MVFLLAGCATTERVGFKPSGRVEVAAQWDDSTGQRTGYNTFEVYLTNHKARTVRFKSVLLNDQELPRSDAGQVPKGFGSVSVGGMEMPMGEKRENEKGNVTWSEFYPTAEAKPGETVVFQINFQKATFQQRLTVMYEQDGPRNTRIDAKGEKDSRSFAEFAATPPTETIEVIIPRFRTPERLITAVTYSLDFKSVYVQYKADVPPQRVLINSREMTFRNLASPEPGTPHMLAMKAPFRIRPGMPLHVELEFGGNEPPRHQEHQDGNTQARHTLVRACNGVSLVNCWHTCDWLRKAGLDKKPQVELLRVDVACDDVKSGTKGGAAGAVVTERAKNFQQHQNPLTAVGFCTALFPEVWNIYGSISDAAVVHSYRFGWGKNPARFIEEEEECLQNAQRSAAPRPFLWLPYVGKHGGRYMDPAELEVQTWMALVRGSRGICYGFWAEMNRQARQEIAELEQKIAEITEWIRGKRKLLSPLALVSERTLDTSVTGGEPSGHIKVYTAWAGEQGMLVLVRNLDYRTATPSALAETSSTTEDPEPRRVEPRAATKAELTADYADGADALKRVPTNPRYPRNPRLQKGPSAFRATAKRSLTVPIQLPEWFRYGGVSDFSGGEAIAAECQERQLKVNLARLETCKLLWLENGDGR